MLLFVFLFTITTKAQDISYPKLFFHHGWLFDKNCEFLSKQTHDPAWNDELKNRTHEFANLWKKNASDLIGQVTTHFQKGYKRKELDATLSVCQTPSISQPLVLNVRPYLKTAMKDQPVRPDFAFVDLVFHELLHTWIVENIKRPTPLEKNTQMNPELYLTTSTLWLFKNGFI